MNDTVTHPARYEGDYSVKVKMWRSREERRRRRYEELRLRHLFVRRWVVRSVDRWQ